MSKSTWWAASAVIALGVVAALLVYRATRPFPPGGVATALPAAVDELARAPAVSPPAPTVAAPPPPPEARPAPPPGPAKRIPIQAGGELQTRLESEDPEERKDALVEARDQRRTSMMEWLNKNSSRRAAAARAAEGR